MSSVKRFLLLVFLIFMVTGCKQKEKELSDSMQLDMMASLHQVAKEAKFETVFEVDELHLNERYEWNLDTDIKVNGLFGSILDTNRTLLFHVNTEEDKQIVYTFIEHLKKKIKESYLEEMSNEKNIIDQAITLDEGTYILFITGPTADKGANEFENICK